LGDAAQVARPGAALPLTPFYGLTPGLNIFADLVVGV
jgi:hypothetical protein